MKFEQCYWFLSRMLIYLMRQRTMKIPSWKWFSINVIEMSLMKMKFYFPVMKGKRFFTNNILIKIRDIPKSEYYVCVIPTYSGPEYPHIPGIFHSEYLRICVNTRDMAINIQKYRYLNTCHFMYPKSSDLNKWIKFHGQTRCFETDFLPFRQFNVILYSTNHFKSLIGN